MSRSCQAEGLGLARSAQTRPHPAASLVPGQRCSGLPAQPGLPGALWPATQGRTRTPPSPAPERTPPGNTARSRGMGVAPPGPVRVSPHSCSFKNKLESSVLGITTPGVHGTQPVIRKLGCSAHHEQTGGSPRTQRTTLRTPAPALCKGTCTDQTALLANRSGKDLCHRRVAPAAGHKAGASARQRLRTVRAGTSPGRAPPGPLREPTSPLPELLLRKHQRWAANDV